MPIAAPEPCEQHRAAMNVDVFPRGPDEAHEPGRSLLEIAGSPPALLGDFHRALLAALSAIESAGANVRAEPLTCDSDAASEVPSMTSSLVRFHGPGGEGAVCDVSLQWDAATGRVDAVARCRDARGNGSEEVQLPCDADALAHFLSYAAAASLRSSLAVRVCAYVLSAHRTRELTTRGLVPLLGSHRVSFVPLWESCPSGSPFSLPFSQRIDALLHKATDDLVAVHPPHGPIGGRYDFAPRITQWCRAAEAAGVAVVGPLSQLRKVADRLDMAETLGAALADMRVPMARGGVSGSGGEPRAETGAGAGAALGCQACNASEVAVGVPASVAARAMDGDALTEAMAAGMRAPFLAKSRVACWAREAHEMAAVCGAWEADTAGGSAGDASDTRDTNRGAGSMTSTVRASTVASTTVLPASLVEGPVLLQAYVPHGARLFKVYSAGGLLHVKDKDSIPDLVPGPGRGGGVGAKGAASTSAQPLTIAGKGPFTVRLGSWHCEGVVFDSLRDNARDVAGLLGPWAGEHRGGQEHGVLQEHERDERHDVDQGQSTTAAGCALREEAVAAIAEALHRSLSLPVLGIDIIVDARDGTHHVIDVNYLPSLKGWPQAEEALARAVRQVAA